MKQKLKMKWVVLVYLIVMAIVYTATLRVEKLESLEDIKISQRTITYNIK